MNSLIAALIALPLFVATLPAMAAQPPPEGSLSALQQRVQDGDGAAMVLLGQAYGLGVGGVPQDHEKAADLFERASRLGIPGTARFAALHRFWGENPALVQSTAAALHGVQRAVEAATAPDAAHVRMLQAAAQAGMPDAARLLGELEEQGGDGAAALPWYVMAARLGDVSSMAKVAGVMESGGDPAAVKQAAELYARAAAGGHVGSMSRLAAILITGAHGLPSDAIGGTAWAIAAAQKGDRSAVQALDSLRRTLTADAWKQAEEMASRIH